MPEEGDERLHHQSQVVLKRENLYKPGERTPLAPHIADETPIVFPPTPPATPRPDTPKKKVSFSEEVTAPMVSPVEPETPRFAIHVLTHNPDTPGVSDSDTEPSPHIAGSTPQTETLTLPEEIRELFAKGCDSDETLQEVLHAIRVGRTRHPKVQLSQCEVRNGYLYYRDRLYVPDDDELYAELTRLCHEIPAAGHPGRARTYQILSRDYYWPSMSSYVRR